MCSAGPAGTCTTSDARTEGHPLRQIRRVPPGVDPDPVAACGQAQRQRGDVHVLPARVDTAQCGQRARVLGHHGDSHPVTSFKTCCQSVRNRSRPNASNACRRAAAPRSAGLGRVGEPPARGGGEDCRVGAQHAGFRGHRLRCGGDRKGEHRHADRHRLDQGQAQAGPAVRMQVRAVGREQRVHLSLRHVVVQMAGRSRKHVRPAPPCPCRRSPTGSRGQLLHQIGSGDPPSADRFVDHDGDAAPTRRCTGDRGRRSRAR